MFVNIYIVYTVDRLRQTYDLKLILEDSKVKSSIIQN